MLPTTDAGRRALRTIAQGLVVTALIAGIAVVNDALTAGRTDYRAIAVAAGTAALTAVVSYIHRRLVDGVKE